MKEYEKCSIRGLYQCTYIEKNAKNADGIKSKSYVPTLDFDLNSLFHFNIPAQFVYEIEEFLQLLRAVTFGYHHTCHRATVHLQPHIT